MAHVQGSGDEDVSAWTIPAIPAISGVRVPVLAGAMTPPVAAGPPAVTAPETGSAGVAGGPAAGDDAEVGGRDSSVVSSVLMLAGVLLISMAIVRGVRRGIERRRGDDASPRERLDSIKAEAAARERAATGEPEGVVDPVRAATELAAMLDTRAARLEALLEDADERIRSLQETLDVPSTDEPSAAAPGDPAAVRRRMAVRVHELAADGLSPLAIARAVEAPLGEVELVLALGPPNEGTSPRD
jgi:hypothetical protein